MMEEKKEEKDYAIRPEVVNYDDVSRWVPALRGHRKLVNSILKFLSIDKVNGVHARHCDTPGIPFSQALVDEEFKLKLRVDNMEVLERFRDGGAFITVSNHPFGALDGIVLLDLVGSVRPDFKVMVNMFLNHITAMRPNFIAVDPSASNDPEKRRTTIQGIREAMTRVRQGHPIGFFPAGAVSRLHGDLRIYDREWQPSIIRLIQQLGVPVVPIFFHGHNSTFFNLLGVISWRIRTLRLPAEVFRRKGKSMHISVGEPIMPEEQKSCSGLEEFGRLLRDKTYILRDIYK